MADNANINARLDKIESILNKLIQFSNFNLEGDSTQSKKLSKKRASESNDAESDKKKKPTIYRKKSTYVIFTQEFFKKHKDSGLSQRDIITQCAMEWKKLTEDDKAYYTKLADKINLEEQEKFRIASESLLDSSSLLTDSSLGSDKKKSKTKSKNGYNVFMSETLKKYSEQGRNSKEAIAIISKEWKSLSQDQKEEYNKKAVKQNAIALDLEDKTQESTEVSKLTDNNFSEAVAAAAIAAAAVHIPPVEELTHYGLSRGSDDEKEKKKKKDKKEKKEKKEKK